MFKIKNVTKKYDEDIALNDVSLTIGSGMNFIIGTSGSGKSTLLKIISGIEKEFEGEVYFENKNIQELTDKEKSYFYNNILGFVWQDFNLLEELTVLENILMPTYLKETQNLELANKILKDLKLNKLTNKQVKFLSGGQKQRVAIARELMKESKVILADEPTSALDKKTTKEIMDILRKISKSKTVIVVTHDISNITSSDSVYELDKGELISKSNNVSQKVENISIDTDGKFLFSNLKNIIKTSVTKHKGRFATLGITLMLGIVFLLTTFSGGIESSGQSAFDELFADYGESILDVSVYNSFMSASGTGGNENDSPNADVEQDIRGLFDKYNQDERTQFVTYIQAFDNIKITMGNKKYAIPTSNNAPCINKLIAGRMANGNENEVVVPKSFVEKVGISNEEIINQEIDFSGEIIKWENDKPIYINTNVKAKVVGVMDTNIYTEFEGKIYEFELEDSFFFSKSALEDVLSQAEMSIDDLDFTIRAKTPKDTIAIKKELNKKGIVPIGRFELIEDIVKLNNHVEKQSSSGNGIIAALTIVMVMAIFVITNIMRKREYAIFKITGYSNSHLRRINILEIITLLLMAYISLIVLSPILNLMTKEMFGVKVLAVSTIGISLLLGLFLAILCYLVTEIICDTTNVNKILKSGEKE